MSSPARRFGSPAWPAPCSTSAPWCPPDRLEHAVDGALRDGLVTLEGLRTRVEDLRRPGRRGLAALDRVLGDRGGPPPESVLERRFLRLVEAHGLPRPELQVAHDGGAVRVDAQFTAARVIVELDGHRTHATRRQRQRDAERSARLGIDGWLVLRFTYDDVVDRPAYVAGTIARALARAA